MQKSGLGAKGVIAFGTNFLVLEKRNGDPDLTGGRVKNNESIIGGLQREIFEETRLIILDFKPIARWSFVKEKTGTLIHGVTFLSNSYSDAVILSDEHRNYFWVSEKDFFNIKFRPSYGLSNFSIKSLIGWQQKARLWQLPQINFRKEDNVHGRKSISSDCQWRCGK